MRLNRLQFALVASVASLISLHASADEFADALAAYDRHEDAIAAQLFQPLAERGDMRAGLFLGAAYYTGRGVPIDRYKSMEWMMRANASASQADFDLVYGHWQTLAESGDPDAQVALGTAYNSNLGVPIDRARALALTRQSAEQGYASGQAQLAAMYDSGEGVEKDTAEALKWISRAAEQGNVWAQCELGGMYQSGRGVKKDRATALGWFRKAADANSAEGQYEVGVAYSDGLGVRKDPVEAARWFRLAAAGGSPLGQHNLAVSYLTGSGVAKDLAEAYQFSTLAAERLALVRPDYASRIVTALMRSENKLSAAQKRAALFRLGERCRDGDGVPQDDVLAYRWMDMSMQHESDEGLLAARRAERDQLAERMRPDQVARAQTLARSGSPP